MRGRKRKNVKKRKKRKEKIYELKGLHLRPDRLDRLGDRNCDIRYSGGEEFCGVEAKDMQSVDDR